MKFEESDLLKGLPKQFFANLVEKVNAKIAQGVDVINLGQGNPDQPTPDYIVKAAQTATENPKNQITELEKSVWIEIFLNFEMGGPLPRRPFLGPYFDECIFD